MSSNSNTAEAMGRESGKVKTLRSGYGFIRPNDASKDIFFHASQLVGITFESVDYGTEVEYGILTDETGRRLAVNVRKL